MLTRRGAELTKLGLHLTSYHAGDFTHTLQTISSHCPNLTHLTLGLSCSDSLRTFQIVSDAVSTLLGESRGITTLHLRHAFKFLPPIIPSNMMINLTHLILDQEVYDVFTVDTIIKKCPNVCKLTLNVWHPISLPDIPRLKNLKIVEVSAYSLTESEIMECAVVCVWAVLTFCCSIWLVLMRGI